MIDWFLSCLFFGYVTVAVLLFCYGLNCYIMIFLFRRRRADALSSVQTVQNRFGDPGQYPDLPRVTTQIPFYNEYNVAKRVMRAVCEMDYPKDRHEIQVLDDSTDETRELVDQTAQSLRAQGHDIRVIRREHRKGYKAGALAEGTEQAKGDLIAIFDADFLPPKDFLLESVPFFLNDERLGLVQARWGHLNRRACLLTRAQSIGIDGHFMVEQAARNWNGLFMNFNGTAGIWRKAAIADGGGWHWDTLTEDMDLSYRVQFAGWKTLFLPNLVVPAEIPEDVQAFKSQQFRWAKGSIQTARKLFPLLAKTKAPLFQKLQAVFHLTHYLVHPLMLTLAILALPVLLFCDFRPGGTIFALIAGVLICSMTAPSALYVVSQRAARPDSWRFQLLYLPVLVMVGVGIAISNSQAVFEALTGKKSGFVRTPKKRGPGRKRI